MSDEPRVVHVRTDSEEQRHDQSQKRFREGVKARHDAADADKPHIHSEDAIKRDPTITLKVFHGESDWVIARDLDDALAMLGEQYGKPGMSYAEAVGLDPEEARDEFMECDLEDPLTIWMDADEWKFRRPELGQIYARQWPVISRYQPETWNEAGAADPSYQVKRTAPIWWWVQANGRGFLASSEY